MDTYHRNVEATLPQGRANPDSVFGSERHLYEFDALYAGDRV